MESRTRLARLLLALLASLAAIRPGPAAGQSRDLRSYVLFAVDGLRSRSLRIDKGDVGVNQGRLFVRPSGYLDAPASELAADEVRIPPDARCRRAVASLPVETGPSCPAAIGFDPPFPSDVAVGVACAFPDTFPACSTVSSRNVIVDYGQTVTLDPGTYRDVKVRGGPGPGVLVLRPGDYTFCTLRTGRRAELQFEGPSLVRVVGDVTIGTGSQANTRPPVASDVKLVVQGRDVRFGRSAGVTADVCAPLATLRIGPGAQAAGRFVARYIRTSEVIVSLPTTTTTTTSSTTTSSTTTSSTTTSSTTTSSTTSSTTTSTTTTSTTSTTSTTAPPVCGDGRVNQASEQCDDGNAVDDDCCSNACQAALDGTPCSDGETCNGQEICQQGVCAAPTPAAEEMCLAPATVALISNFEDGTVTEVSTLTNAIGATVPVGRGAWGVALHPRGHEAYVTAREDDLLAVLDTGTGTVSGTIAVGRVPLGVVFDPTGSRAYVAAFGDHRLVVIDTATRAVAGTIPVGKGPSGVVLGPGGTRLYVSNFASNTVSVVDLASSRVVATVKTGKRPLEMAVDGQEGRVYVTNFGGATVSVIGTVSDTVLRAIRVGKKPFGVALEGDGGHAWVTNARSDTVSVIDVDACVEAAAVPVGRGPLGIGLDPSGARAYVANASENRIVVIDTATRAVTGSLAVGKLPVAFGPFIGPLANDCPRAAVVCNDADPGTVDVCTLDGGCLYTPLAGIETVAADLSALDALVRAARAGDLGSPETATTLGRLVTNARGELTPGAGALRKRLLRISREMGGFTRALGRGLRRGRIRCGIGLRLLDIARGTRADARRLAGRQ